MCLHSKQSTPYVAEKDITVYKVLAKSAGSNRYISPYCLETYTKGTNRPKRKYGDPYFNGISYVVESGFLHAYITLTRADAAYSYLTALIPFFLEIIPMIIPKGTSYYIGDDGDICSETLIWK